MDLPKNPQDPEFFPWLNDSRNHSPKRLHTGNRNEFDRDFARILHSSSFRRLQGKTQVWGVLESDYFRTRLTHSLEAGQIGGSLAKAYGLDEKVVMASCFAHDIGHPPFGHDGATALDNFSRRVSSNSVVFDDNAQTFRVLVYLDSMFPDKYGMDLCAATLDGVLKYKTEAAMIKNKSGYYKEDSKEYTWVIESTGTGKKRNPIVMFVELADDIAYACHDLQDALRAGFIAKSHLEEKLNSSDVTIYQKAILKKVIGFLNDTQAEYGEEESLRRNAKKAKSDLIDCFINKAINAKEYILPRFKDVSSYGEERWPRLFGQPPGVR